MGSSSFLGKLWHTKLLWLQECSKKKETTTKINGKKLKIYVKWLNQNVYHRSSLSSNIAENKDSLWRGGKIIGEQEISWKIYEDVAGFLCQFYSLDLVSSIIARKEAKHKLFMTVYWRKMKNLELASFFSIANNWANFSKWAHRERICGGLKNGPQRYPDPNPWNLGMLLYMTKWTLQSCLN